MWLRIGIRRVEQSIKEPSRDLAHLSPAPDRFECDPAIYIVSDRMCALLIRSR